MKIPNWIRPKEANEPKYWFHLAIIVGIIYLLMQWYQPQPNQWYVYLLYLGIGDITAHSILKLD